MTINEETAILNIYYKEYRMKNDYEFLNTSIDGHILEVTIKRPDVYNALHPPSQQEFHEVWNEFADDEELIETIIFLIE